MLRPLTDDHEAKPFQNISSMGRLDVEGLPQVCLVLQTQESACCLLEEPGSRCDRSHYNEPHTSAMVTSKLLKMARCSTAQTPKVQPACRSALVHGEESQMRDSALLAIPCQRPRGREGESVTWQKIADLRGSKPGIQHNKALHWNAQHSNAPKTT